MSVASRAERGHTEISLCDDARFFGALGSIVRHMAERAGLANGAQVLADAAMHACRSAFPLLGGRDPSLRFIIEDFADRIEVTLEHSGEPVPVEGLDSFATGMRADQPGRSDGTSLLKQVDRVLYETRNGSSRLTLVKYIPGATPREPADVR
jgi:hypothetical protein